MFTIKETAKKLSVHPVSVRRWVQSGAIDHLKIGKSVRFTQEHIDKFIQVHTVKAKTNYGESSKSGGVNA